MNYKRIMPAVLLGGAILQAYAQEVLKEPTTVRDYPMRPMKPMKPIKKQL